MFLASSGAVHLSSGFSVFTQVTLLVHSIVGLLSLAPVSWYLVRHWRRRGQGQLSHLQFLGYVAAFAVLVSHGSGGVETCEALFSDRVSRGWDLAHLVSGMAVVVLVAVHLLASVVRSVNNPCARLHLRAARRRYLLGSALIGGSGLVVCVIWAHAYAESPTAVPFPATYNWRFGEDRPFSPSLVRMDAGAWERETLVNVRQAVGDDRWPHLEAAIAGMEAEPIGLFGRVQQGLDAIECDAHARSRVDEALAAAAERVRLEGAVVPSRLSGSANCGRCHEQIYREWLPSAHRYSSMDHLFQRVQSLMAVETTPEHTRYCAGCHDPISLLAGAKNGANVTLSAEGADEGVSCLVCHSIVQADVQGNADYTIRPPIRYIYEEPESAIEALVSDFLIRAAPEHHVASYSRALHRTPEFCGACHKQYMDREINRDIGKVQGQNQYDSWKNSHWNRGYESDRTVTCRECHMPLQASFDPARGDVVDRHRREGDGRHRSHRMLGANQYVPLLQKLEGGEEHVELIESWLRGEIPIPEIEDRWASGPTVLVEIDAPAELPPGVATTIGVRVTNNKAGHDFPTGPLDMIESWLEIMVVDEHGVVIRHVGGLNGRGDVADSPLHFKADGFDRDGELIDRHNLWDLVGKRNARSLFAGMTDRAAVGLACPASVRAPNAPGVEHGNRNRSVSFAFESHDVGCLRVEARLWYRKAHPTFLGRVCPDEGLDAPTTLIGSATAVISVRKGVTEQ
ncbi:MAG: hypothetical protein JNL80_08055 [Phycisphaerae bacterium]|nr:hypothetical protein [Phycisphaerae bacterium]